MRKIAIPAVAGIFFLAAWLGSSPEAEVSEERALWSDRISTSSAQAEQAGAKSEEVLFEGGADAKPTPASAAPTAPAPECVPPQAMADLAQRKKSLEDREGALNVREQELSNREKAIEERMKELQVLRAELDQVKAARTKELEEKVARTVEILEAMTPKAASQLLSTTDEKLAVDAIGRMSTAKVSKIMNLMEPKRSVRLMELLAGNGAPATVKSATAPETNPKKEEKL